MRAIVQASYGSPEVLQLRDVQAPTPRDDEILVKVRASSVTAVDCTFRQGQDLFARMFTGLVKPKRSVPGGEFAGEVAAVGKSVTEFSVGDAVFGSTAEGFGAHAEFVCVPASGVLVKKPEAMSAEQAAVISYGGLTALPFLRDEAKLQEKQSILVNGASGPVGATAVQLAKYFGAEVTGVCSSANVNFVRSLGADTVIDYTQQDFTTNGARYDIIFDPAGKSSFSACKGSLTENGLYLSAALTPGILAQMALTSKFGKKTARIAFTGLRPAAEKKKDLVFVTDLVLAGRLKFPIDRTYPLERIAEAHDRVQRGHRSGNVVVTIAE